MRNFFTSLIFSAGILLLGGCTSPSRMGMIQDPQSGLQFGSVIEKNLFIDASQFKNCSIKVAIRNSSGDNAYHVGSFSGDINTAFSQKGFIPTQSDSFGIKIDINVLYSGQFQASMQSQYGFLGGAAGGIAGYRSGTVAGTSAGMLVGATIGSIVGSNVTDDTYIVIAEVSLGVTDNVGASNVNNKIISFGSSPKLQEETPKNFTPFREVIKTKIAVYAGGRNASQQQVALQVKKRLVGIISDSI